MKLPKKVIYPCLTLLALLLFWLIGLWLVRSPQTIILPPVKEFLGFKQLLPSPYPYPVDRHVLPPPELSAKSVVVLDADSMSSLYEKNPNERLRPASTTKIMTALTALDYYSLDQVLTVGDFRVEGSTVGLKPGEQITVKNLLYGLLVSSGNDAAEVLGQNYPGGMASFVASMNEKARKLNLTGTHFVNPTGLDEEGHYSTAKDLARLSVTALKNSLFAQIVSAPEATITDVTGKIVHQLKNTNELVGQVDGVKGIKTGWTEEAGECLVTLEERENRRIIIALLGSSDRFGETKKIIDWVFTNFTWESVTPAN